MCHSSFKLRHPAAAPGFPGGNQKRKRPRFSQTALARRCEMSDDTPTPPTWEGKIKPMFEPYVTCMKGPGVFNKIGRTIDLSDYDEVVANGIIIYGMIKNQAMPPPPRPPLPEA